MIYESMRVPSRPRGGALPVYQRQSGIYAPGAGVSARVDDSAARIAGAAAQEEATALAGLGKSLQGAADAGLRAYDDYARSKATQLVTEYRRNMNQALYGDDGILTRQGEAALDADEQRAARAEQLRGALLEDADDATRRCFQRLADDYDADASLKAQRYAGEQRIVMLNRNDEAAARERGEFAAARYAHQQDFDRGAGEGLWYEEQRLRRQGCCGEALARGLKEFSSGVFGGAIRQALADGDIPSAERLLAEGSKLHGEGDSASSRMTAPDIARAETAVRAARDALAARAEAAAKRAGEEAEEARIESGYRAVMSGIDELPSTFSVEERKARLARLTADMEPKLRAAVRKRAEADIDERELVRKAGVVEELGMVDRMRKANPRATSNDMIRLIRESGLSDDARAAAIRGLEAEREGAGNAEASAAGLRAFRSAYDARAGAMSDTEARALIFDLNLNAKDRESALAYSGRGAEYSQARIDTLINSVLGRDTSGKIRSELYSALMRRIPDGEVWDDKRIRAEIYNLSQTEGGWFGRGFKDFVLEDAGGRFRPDIPEAMRTVLNLELEQTYPFFASAPEKARALMRQGVWLRRQYGITPDWTDEELKLLQGVGET